MTDVNSVLPDNVPLRINSRRLRVHSPLAIANFGYSGSTRVALVEWLLMRGARFSPEEMQNFAQNELSVESRALMTLNNYMPFTKKGAL